MICLARDVEWLYRFDNLSLIDTIEVGFARCTFPPLGSCILCIDWTGFPCAFPRFGSLPGFLFPCGSAASSRPLNHRQLEGVGRDFLTFEYHKNNGESIKRVCDLWPCRGLPLDRRRWLVGWLALCIRCKTIVLLARLCPHYDVLIMIMMEIVPLATSPLPTQID